MKSETAGEFLRAFVVLSIAGVALDLAFDLTAWQLFVVVFVLALAMPKS